MDNQQILTIGDYLGISKERQAEIINMLTETIKPYMAGGKDIVTGQIIDSAMNVIYTESFDESEVFFIGSLVTSTLQVAIQIAEALESLDDLNDIPDASLN